ncbi:MAG: TolC family protein [Rickettsiaceae bacterium]|nr:TolC family protein [Rickettsiaceae bacterium]
MKKYIYTFCICFAPLYSEAIELKDALTKAYLDHPKIKIYQENFIATIQEFPQVLSEEFLPDVSLSTRTTTTKTKYKNYPGTPTTNSDSFSRQVQVTQPLLSGGTAVSTLAAIKHKIDASKVEYISKEQEFLLEAIDTYISLLTNKEKADASRSFVLSAQKQYESEEEKLKVGQSTLAEVAGAKAQYAKALYTNADDNAKYIASQSAFKSLFKVDPVDITFPDHPEGMPSDYEDFKNKAIAASLSLRSIHSQTKAQKNLVVAEYGKLLPKLSAQVSAQEGSSPSNALPTNLKTKSYSTTLSLSVPIVSSGGSEHSRIRAAKAKLRSAVHSLDSAKNGIESQLISDWETYISSKIALEYASQEVAARKLAYEGTKTAFDVGVSTLVDVLKAEKDMYDSMAQHIQTKRGAIISAYKIKSDLAQLTAKNMGLSAKIFDPDAEFRKTKFRILGF